MTRFAFVASALVLAAGLALGAGIAQSPAFAQAQDAKPKTPPAKAKVVKTAAKVGPGMKVCNYKFPSGEKRSWTCEKAQPCCAWDEINYTKCGSTITGCL